MRTKGKDSKLKIAIIKCSRTSPFTFLDKSYQQNCIQLKLAISENSMISLISEQALKRAIKTII